MSVSIVRDSTIDSVLFELAQSGRPTFTFRCGPVTARAAQIARQADGFARWLMTAGIGPADRVALWLPNGLPWVTALIGVARAGAASVPISTRLSPREVHHIVKHSRSRVVVVARHFLKRDYAVEARELAARVSAEGTPVRLVIVDPLDGPLPHEASAISLPGSRPDDPAVVQYTSGTTGVPKGCVLSHRAFTNNARLSAERAGLRPDDVVLCPSPFFHLFGSLTGLMGAFSIGASFVSSPTFDAAECSQVIEKHRVTHLVAVPTMWLDLMAVASPGTLPSLRGGVWGGAGFPRGPLERAIDPHGFGWDLQAIYGMTEAPTLTQSSSADTINQKLETVGRATPAVEVDTVDPATRGSVGPGKVGEIWARGYNRMLGYLDDLPATEARFVDDWIRSGDLGILDQEGFLQVVGRLTDMIITGGANVYPREVEDVILELEGVSLAAVVGREDERLGEVPVAWVQAEVNGTPDAREILAHCRKNLADYKVPREVFLVRDIPLTASGKIHKALLKQQANQRN